MTETLHSLNAARVIAEYAVVHYHISFLFPDAKGLLSGGVVPDNLMSFFFVLSGFVAMHTNMETDFADRACQFAYIIKRMRKTYPLYLLLFLADLPGTVIGQDISCPYFWVSLAAQPLLVQPWLGSQHISISNGVGWYLCTLYWLWLFFPFINVRWMLSSTPWLMIYTIYVFSVSVWVALTPYNIIYTRAVPIFRLLEFLMGCGVAFTLDCRIHGLIVLLGLGVFFGYCVLETQMEWTSEQLHGNCTLWIQRKYQRVNPTIVLSKFSIVWALLIHWLASKELFSPTAGIIQLLQHDFFKSLSRFSLHLYLSHYSVACALRSASTALGIFHWWDLDTMIIACYVIAYLLSRWVQPLLDRLECKKAVFPDEAG